MPPVELNPWLGHSSDRRNAEKQAIGEAVAQLESQGFGGATSEMIEVESFARGFYQETGGGAVYWSHRTGAFIDKRILDRYRQLGANNCLGYPVIHNAMASMGSECLRNFEHGVDFLAPGHWREVLQPAPPQPSWWQRRGENPRGEQWYEVYFVSGTSTNEGASNIQDLAITIFEVTVDDFGNFRGEANVGSTEHGLVAPSHSVPGATAPNKKDWKWFIPVAWVVGGPIYMDYLYRALISAKDVSGNPYPPVTSAELRVTVSVSTRKWLSGKFAQQMAITAAVMAASIILAAAAAVAYGAASAAAAVAIDPPEPDPNFRNRIPLPGAHHRTPTGPDRNVILLFPTRRAHHAHRTHEEPDRRPAAGSTGRGGHTVGRDRRGGFGRGNRPATKLANEVRTLGPQAKQDIQSLVPPGTDLWSGREQMRTTGLTTDLADQMQLLPEQREGFDALLRSDLAQPDTDIAGTIDATVAPLTEFADSLD